MHELGLCEAIVDAVEARAGGRRVRFLALAVGGAHAADEDALRQALAMVAAGTVLEGAQLELRVEPVRLRCATCGAESTGDAGCAAAVCPRCHGVDVEMVGGDLVVLDQLDLEPPSDLAGEPARPTPARPTPAGPAPARPISVPTIEEERP